MKFPFFRSQRGTWFFQTRAVLVEDLWAEFIVGNNNIIVSNRFVHSNFWYSLPILVIVFTLYLCVPGIEISLLLQCIENPLNLIFVTLIFGSYSESIRNSLLCHTRSFKRILLDTQLLFLRIFCSLFLVQIVKVKPLHKLRESI